MKILPVETQNLIRQLAENTPSLADLTADQAETVAKAVLADFLKGEMKRAILSEKVSFEVEAEKFLAGLNSAQTKRAYRTSLSLFQAWLDQHSITLVDLTPAAADDFIRDQRSSRRSDETVRARVASISSFYAFLERRYAEVRNPFRGTRVRPKSTHKTAVIPSAPEIETIIEHADPEIKAAIGIMVETGLRIGGLAELRIKPDGSFHTFSKSKPFAGPDPMSPELLAVIQSAGLSAFRPFNPQYHKTRGGATAPETLATMALTARITRLTAKLKEAGLISDTFSPHDFRHAFAEANAHRGLIWLRDRLGHASISVSERYLRNTLGKSTVSV